MKTAGIVWLVNIDSSGNFLSSQQIDCDSSQYLYAPTAVNQMTENTSTQFRLNQYAGAYSNGTTNKLLELDFKVTEIGNNTTLRSQVTGTYYAFGSDIITTSTKSVLTPVVSYGNSATLYDTSTTSTGLLHLTPSSEDSYTTPGSEGVWLKESGLKIKIDPTTILTSVSGDNLRKNHAITCDVRKYPITTASSYSYNTNYNPQMTDSSATTSITLPKLYFTNSAIREQSGQITVKNITASASATALEKISGISAVTGGFTITTSFTITDLFGTFYSDMQRTQLIKAQYYQRMHNTDDNGNTLLGPTKPLGFTDIDNSLGSTSSYNGGIATWTSSITQYTHNVSAADNTKYSFGLSSNFSATKYSDSTAFLTSQDTRKHYSAIIFDKPSSVIKTNTTTLPTTQIMWNNGIHVKYYNNTTSYASPIETTGGDATDLSNMLNPSLLIADLGSHIYDHDISLVTSSSYNNDAQLVNGRFHAAGTDSTNTQEEAYNNYTLISQPNYSSLVNKSKYHTRVFCPDKGNGASGVGVNTITFTLNNVKQVGSTALTAANLPTYVKAFYYVYTHDSTSGSIRADKSTGWMSLQKTYNGVRYGVPESTSETSYPYGQDAQAEIPGGRSINTETSVTSPVSGTGTIVYTAQCRNVVFHGDQNTVVVLLLEFDASDAPLSFGTIQCTV
jgi:hypothetical protein